MRVFALLQSDDYVNKRVSLATLDEMLSLCGRQGSFSTPHAGPILDVLLPLLPGRIWEGKDALLRTVAAVATHGGHAARRRSGAVARGTRHPSLTDRPAPSVAKVMRSWCAGAGGCGGEAARSAR